MAARSLTTGFVILFFLSVSPLSTPVAHKMLEDSMPTVQEIDPLNLLLSLAKLLSQLSKLINDPATYDLQDATVEALQDVYSVVSSAYDVLSGDGDASDVDYVVQELKDYMLVMKELVFSLPSEVTDQILPIITIIVGLVFSTIFQVNSVASYASAPIESIHVSINV